MTEVREFSTITARGQTTVPASVRRALGVAPGGRLMFAVQGNTVTVQAADPEEESDPVVDAFLAFLEKDMRLRPEAIQPVPPELMRRMQALTEGVVVDFDAPIEDEVDL